MDDLPRSLLGALLTGDVHECVSIRPIRLDVMAVLCRQLW